MLFVLLPAFSGADEATEHWGVSLTWSPQFCYDQPGDTRELQCAEQHGFVLGGFDLFGGAAEDEVCSNRHADIPHDVTERMLLTMWNKATMKRQWNQFGRCSGWEMMDYFVRADYLANRVTIPEEFKQPFARLGTTANNIRLLFQRSNKDVNIDSIMPRCDGIWLRDVVFCVDKDLKYRSCSSLMHSGCPAQVWVRGINIRLKPRLDD
ncbi:MAG: hypothetical protein JWR07_3782 [Nevskia sp.]|nr:hypothetical protein [Nevskia sp.]